MTTHDPFELLKSANAVPDARQLPDVASDPNAQTLLEQIVGSDRTTASSRHRRRMRGLLIPLVAAAAVTTTAAAAWIMSRQADDPTQIACFAAVDLDADVVGLAGSADPVGACRDVWERGELDAPRPAALSACVLPTGIVGVFPADDDDPCVRLGLDPADLSERSDPIVEVQERLADRFLADCVAIEDAIDAANEELTSAGIEGWTVVAPEMAQADRPCGSAAVDVSSRTITVVPVPRPPAG